MAPPQDQHLTIAFHGNNDFSSNRMQELLGENCTEYQFLYPTDLNLFHPYIDMGFDKSLTQTLEECKFVILIGLHSIFSSSMLSLITSIPALYGLDGGRENEFWERAVVVFDVGTHQNPEHTIRTAIDNNSGIRELTNRVGGKYTYVSQDITRERFIEQFGTILDKMDDDNEFVPKISTSSLAALCVGCAILGLGLSFGFPKLVARSNFRMWAGVGLGALTYISKYANSKRLSYDCIAQEEFFSIINIAEIQSKSSYSFFPNAAIVFTHADTIDVNLNEENLERHLRGIITSEKFAHIGELIELVEGRYMFINGENDKPENRFHVLKELFHLTRTKLNVYINGYDGFEGKEMKRIFRADPDSNSFRNNFTKYDVEYYFNPDLNLFRRYEKLDLETEITQALNKLSGIGNGVSVIILLINLEEIFNEEIFDLFLNLPYTYQLGEDFKGDFWDYACIVFKGPSGDTEFVERNLERNSVLKKMVQKVKSRYFLVNNQTSSEECYENILNLVKRVKLDTEGKTYIDGTVLKEMRLIMEESTDLRTARKIVEMKEGVTNLRLLRDGIPIFKTKTGPKIVIKANNFFWSRKWISPLIGYFLLKNINPNKAKDFKEKYKNQTRVTTEEFAEVFLEVMKEM